LAALSGLAPFFIDTYLPSFREMGVSLHATPGQVQQTLTAYLVPFALMNLWHGALSDAVGRRPVVLWSLAILGASSAACALAGSIGTFWCLRAVQGAACGAGLVVGRAVVRDVYDGPAAQRVMAHVAALFAIAPAVAPLVGGWLHEVFGWRSVFVFLSLLSVGLAGWSAWAFPETMPRDQPTLFTRQPSHADMPACCRTAGSAPQRARRR
jgi:DHA1 family bicyclomycin/chloramphenicol resistance-like MFS transporter